VAKLRFYYGTMGAGKSTMALQIHHNLVKHSQGLLITQHDRDGRSVSSALGVSAAAEVIGPHDDLFTLASTEISSRGEVDFMVCDEAQFYLSCQIDQLVRVVDDLDIDVFAFGLLTDFMGHLFPATARLLEMADERNEIQVESRCWCGELATHNARLVDGVQVYHGDVVVVDDGSDTAISYELRCRRHWIDGEGKPAKESLRSVG